MKKPDTVRTVFIQKQYGYLLRETLLKKGYPSNSLPKTFNLNFAPMGYSPDMKRVSLSFQREYPIGAKFGLKVFGKGFGGEPFFRKVSPDICPVMLPYRYSPYCIGLRYYLQSSAHLKFLEKSSQSFFSSV